jgi:chemotaxis protein CheD
MSRFPNQSVATEIPGRYAHPGDVVVARAPCIITTVLGSCVSICMRDPVARVGGLNHFLLPMWNGHGEPSPRFGNVAIYELVKQLIHMGAHKARLEAQVFGGSLVLEALRHKVDGIGSQNLAAALTGLQLEGIHVLRKEIGGAKGCKLVFDVTSGEAAVRHF